MLSYFTTTILGKFKNLLLLIAMCNQDNRLCSLVLIKSPVYEKDSCKFKQYFIGQYGKLSPFTEINRLMDRQQTK